MHLGTLWHCTLVSSTPSQSVRLVFRCVVFWCWVSLAAPVTISLIEFYFIMIFIIIVVTIVGIFMAIHYFLNYTLGFLWLSSSGSANIQLPRCFRPYTFSLNIGLNMLPSDSFMSCLHSLLGYSTGEFQALQLIVQHASKTTTNFLMKSKLGLDITLIGSSIQIDQHVAPHCTAWGNKPRIMFCLHFETSVKWFPVSWMIPCINAFSPTFCDT